MNRREFLMNSGLAIAGANAGAQAAATRRPGAAPKTTLLLEDRLRLGAHHLESLVDERGRTYFDVFLGNPPEAVHDWPDFVDLPARYWEGCILAGSALSTTVASQGRLAGWLFSKFEDDGLAHRPDGPISAHIAELFDQSRLLYALNSRVMESPADDQARRRLVGLADGLKRRSTRQGDYAYIDKIGLYFGGTLIRPMLQAGIVLNRPDLIDLSAALARGVISHSDLFGQDGSFTGHVHGALCCIAGIVAVGVKTGDRKMVERGRTAFEFARSISTDFGWVPELSKRDDDVIACETCSIMDYLDAALLLARHVDAAYYDVAEKTARNHLWESQILDASWTGSGEGTDEDGIIRSRLHDRLAGSFCGWSAPHCSLAYYESLSNGWVRTPAMRSRYLGKVRAQQNCCGAAGIRALYQVWSSAITEDAGQVSVNMSLDRATPRVGVTSFLPFEGTVRIAVQQDSNLRWRRPAYCTAGDVRVKAGETKLPVQAQGPYLSFGHGPAGTVIELSLPLPKRRQSLTIGNHGYQQYRYDVDWRGDTVTAIRPDPANAVDAFTKLMNKRVTAFYNREGPGPLYRRQSWSAGLEVQPAPAAVATAKVDWYKL
jgi:hypothetical protein